MAPCTSPAAPVRPNLPRVGGLQSYQGLEDGYIAKLDRSRRRIVWSTYLGSPGEDEIDSMAVDARGHVFVSGFAAAGFPTTHGAFDPTFNGVGECCDGLFGDAFVAELSPDGSRLLYSTYLGGSGHDRTNTLALAEDGSVVVTGFTGSADFPTTRGALDATFGGGTGTFEDVPVDAFAAKLSPDGSRLVYSTYLGGSGDDVGNSVAVDDDGSAYFTGFTGSPEFPTTRGALKPRPEATVLNGYVTKLDRTGRVAWSTYLGGTNRDSGWGHWRRRPPRRHRQRLQQRRLPRSPPAPRRRRSAACATSSWPSSTGRARAWTGRPISAAVSTRTLGATVAVDEEGNADVVGSTVSTDFPVTRDAFQPANAGGFDLAISRLDRNGRLRFASYLGGRGDDFGGAAGLDQRGDFYPGGMTSST